MGAGEGGEDQLAGVRLPFIDVHPGHPLVKLGDFGHIGEVELGVDALGEHIHA